MTAGIFHGPRATKARERVHNFVTGLPDEWHEYRDSWHDKNRRPRRIGEVVVLSLALSVGVPVALHTSKPAGHELRLDPGGKADGAPQAPPSTIMTLSPSPSPTFDTSPAGVPTTPDAPAPAPANNGYNTNTGIPTTQDDSTTFHCDGYAHNGNQYSPHAEALPGTNPDPANVYTVISTFPPSTSAVARGIGATVTFNGGGRILVGIADFNQVPPSQRPTGLDDSRLANDIALLPDANIAAC